MTVETRYFRSDQQTINGLLAYILSISQSLTSTYKTATDAGSRTVTFQAKVSVRHSDGSETVIQDYITLFSRTTNGAGYQSANWNCPETSLVSTDAIVVSIYITVYTVETIVTFITEQLGASKLDAATWTFTLYTQRYYDSIEKATTGFFYFGNGTYNSCITNFTWSIVAVHQFQGDGLTFVTT